MGEEVQLDGHILRVFKNGSEGYNISFKDPHIVKGMEILRSFISGEDEVVVVLVPTESSDSFADQVVKEVEEFEQLALDI